MLPHRALTLRAAAVIAVLLVVFRSFVWLWWEQSFVNSDEATVGLMAMHLASAKVFPLMYYGQAYMLAVEAWLAAPLFLVFGPSIAVLQLPVVAMNVAVALLLLRLLVRESGLSPAAALTASLFFVLAPTVTASRLTQAVGGDIEPFLYVLLLWMLRARPAWFGVMAAIGILNREFTVYGLAAIVLWEISSRSLSSPAALRRRVLSLGLAASLIWAVQWLRPFSALLGPGTTSTQARSVLEAGISASAHVCWQPALWPSNVRWLTTVNLATLFGWHTDPLWRYVRSGIEVGHAWTLIPLVFVGLAAVFVAAATWRPWPRESVGLMFVLVMTGVLSALAYALVGCEVEDFPTLRYTLLALLVPVGAAGALLRQRRWPVLRAITAAAVFSWALASAFDHGRLLAEYLTNPPRNEYRQLTDFLLSRGVRFGKAPYWTAYVVDFMSGERIKLGSSDYVRIAEYQRLAAEHRDEAVSVTPAGLCNEPGDILFRGFCIAPLDAGAPAK